MQTLQATCGHQLSGWLAGRSTRATGCGCQRPPTSPRCSPTLGTGHCVLCCCVAALFGISVSPTLLDSDLLSPCWQLLPGASLAGLLAQIDKPAAACVLVLSSHLCSSAEHSGPEAVCCLQFFRVYSPISFGRKYDKEGAYIRHFLPVLKVQPT